MPSGRRKRTRERRPFLIAGASVIIPSAPTQRKLVLVDYSAAAFAHSELLRNRTPDLPTSSWRGRITTPRKPSATSHFGTKPEGDLGHPNQAQESSHPAHLLSTSASEQRDKEENHIASWGGENLRDDQSSQFGAQGAAERISHIGHSVADYGATAPHWLFVQESYYQGTDGTFVHSGDR